MTQVTIHGIGEPQFAAFKAHFSAFHDFTFTPAASGKLAVSGRGVRGTLLRDGATGDVTVTIDAHPAVVTTGYLLGLVYDQLTTISPKAGA